MYDCTDYAVNLFNCPTVAYSGEIDKQKQAADVMAKALADEGHRARAHHRPEDRAQRTTRRRRPRSTARIDAIVASRPRPAAARRCSFTTYTLRYNQLRSGSRIDGLDEHWERARVDAELRSGDRT